LYNEAIQVNERYINLDQQGVIKTLVFTEFGYDMPSNHLDCGKTYFCMETFEIHYLNVYLKATKQKYGYIYL
jgi:hypothetical protein